MGISWGSLLHCSFAMCFFFSILVVALFEHQQCSFVAVPVLSLSLLQKRVVVVVVLVVVVVVVE